MFFKYKRAKIRPIVMDPRTDNPTSNAQRAPAGTREELEASTPPKQATHSQARSHSGGRPEGRGGEGRDDERRHSRLRQPAIGSPGGNREELEAAPAPYNSDHGSNAAGRPRTQSAMSETTSESMSSIHATWNARMAQGSYGGGQPQGTSGSLGPLGEQPQEAAQYSLPGPTVAPSTASLEDRLQRLPTGQVYRQPRAALDVESIHLLLDPDLAEEAAQYSLPGSTVSRRRQVSSAPPTRPHAFDSH